MIERWTITDPTRPGEQWAPTGDPAELAAKVARKQAAGFWSQDLQIIKVDITAEVTERQAEEQESAALDAIADFRAFRRGLIRTIRHLVQSGQITLPLNLRQWWTDQATALLNPGDAGGNMKVGG